jgi:hypothetical protein
MAYTLFDMVRDGVVSLGRIASNTFTCNSVGSTTTAVNSKFNSLKPIYKDEDKALINGTLLVISTTDGLAPQGEWQRISAYTETTGTITVDDDFSAVIGDGDRCMIIHNQFPIEELVELANQALADLGQFYKVDTSLTTSGTRNYTLPIATKGRRPVSVEIYIEADSRTPVSDFEYYGATAPGTEATIQLKHTPPEGKTLYITYATEHPRVSTYDDVIWEDVPEAVAKWGLAVQINKWQNPDDNATINALNDSQRTLEYYKQTMVLWKPPRAAKWSVLK